ncbi:helix-turn-helix domain-containing protein [Paenibacillus sp. FSL L8-0436]|uniref:TetR/AcrR family transcriptional regulator n=1 Tax=Paenibacillus sp. FSL L8-0436 TaxID=2954686 RepID=UPI003158130E
MSEGGHCIPKVSEAYTENRINEILDAALEVSARKPLHKVTMKDIVRQTGLSQGGVYKYFANIEEVWFALSDRFDLEIDFKGFLTQLFAASLSPDQTLRAIFTFIGQEITASIESGYSKLAFELNAIYASQPELVKKQLAEQAAEAEAESGHGYNYFFQQLMNYCAEGEAKGQFRPLVPLTDILMLIQVTVDGIIRDATLELCFAGDELPAELSVRQSVDRLMDSLYISTMTLLGGF